MPDVAVIWDFDGTLADTRAKNYAVACRIVETATGRSATTFPALSSEDAYEAAYRRVRNWRELYTAALGFPPEAVDALGTLWTPYQLADHTPVRPFTGIPEAVRALDTARQGIVSQNARRNIARMLTDWALHEYFRLIVGYEEVPAHRQKPAPDGLLACIERLLPGGSGTVVYVGDHEADAECARNAAGVLSARGAPTRVVAVAARFGGMDRPDRWRHAPDHIAERPQDVTAIVAELIAG